MKLPEKVILTEVGPRDGFQNIKEFIPTQTKIEIARLLLEAGFPRMEATSFVNPKAVPQMQDAREVVKALQESHPKAELYALVPNFTGAGIAQETGLKHITYVFSASEEHNVANVRRPITESVEELAKIKVQFPSLHIKVGMSVVFGCPFKGDVPVEQALKLIGSCLEIGVPEITLCDTIGVANPQQTDILLRELKKNYPDQTFGFHFHDTRGMGLANVLVALQHGYVNFDASVGGLGGCPFTPGAAGNISSEDLVYMLEQMGVKTGIALEAALQAARIARERINTNLTGHLVHVG